MSIAKFEDIIAWKKARLLNGLLYKLLKNHKDYYYKDQILRAALSIMNNIAEGYGRKSKNEFIQFLYIANGSCNEVKSMLYIGLDNNYFNEKTFLKLFELTNEIGRIIIGFSRSITFTTTKTMTKH